MTDGTNMPSSNFYDYLSLDEQLALANAKTPESVPEELGIKVLNLQESITKQQQLSSEIAKAQDTKLMREYNKAVEAGEEPYGKADIVNRLREGASAGARVGGSAIGGLVGLTPAGAAIKMGLAGIAGPELGDLAAAGMDVLTGKSEKGFKDTYSDYRKENLLNLQMPTLEGAVEAGLSSLGGIGGPSASPTISKALGGKSKAVDFLKQEAENLKSGDVSGVAGFLGGNIKGLSKTLRDGVTKVGQKAVELLNSPQLSNTKTLGQTIDEVRNLRTSIATERLNEVTKAASKTRATIVPVLDSAAVDIANKTGAALPTEMGIARETIDSAINEISPLIDSLSQFKVGKDSLLALEKLKSAIPVDEAMKSGVVIRGLRNAIKKFERLSMGDKELSGRSNQIAVMLDDIATSVDDAVKNSLNASVSSPSGLARKVTFDAAKYDEATDSLRTLFEMEDALDSGLASQASQTRNLTTKLAKEVPNKSIGETLMQPVSGLTKFGLRGALQSVFPKFGRTAADEIASYAGNKDIGLDILRSLVSADELGTMNGQRAALANALVASKDPVSSALNLDLPDLVSSANASENPFITPDSTGGFVPADQLPVEQIPVEQQALTMTPEQDMGFDPTLQGIGNIDSSTFYDDKVNVPDQSVLDEKEQNAKEIGTLPRSSAALVNLSETGKDLSDLGFSEEVAKSAGSLLGGSKEDQRLGLSMLQKDKPSLFEMSPLPGFNSMVDGIIQDDSEKQRIQQKIREVLKGDPNRETQALEAVRQNKELPKWSYKYLGGEDQMTFEDKFLQDVEGNRTKAYLDTKGNPTIGTGVNLAAQSIDGLREMNVPEEILQKIAPAIGAKGSRAASILKYNPIELTDEEAMELSKAVKKANYDVLDELVKQDIGASLEDLPIEGKTVLLSLGYNFGSNLKKNKPEIWNAAVSGKWDKVQKLLQGMNLDNKGLRNRRLKEAALLNPLVEKKMQLAMNSEVDQPAVDGNVELPDGTKKTVYRF